MLRIAITEGEAADADYIQLRAPGIDARELAERARRLMGQGFQVLVNDRVDVAIACGARGVHLRSHAVSPQAIRKIVPQHFLITVACHTIDDVLQAAQEGADYALLAPIFTPLSKQSGSPPLGLRKLADACRAPIPVIALGGITAQTVEDCKTAGAAGIAGITLFRSLKRRTVT